MGEIGARGSSTHMACKGLAWRPEEHEAFMAGLQVLGKGDWRGISRNYVRTRTPTQVASHAQKYFLRLTSKSKRRSRFCPEVAQSSDDSMDDDTIALEALVQLSTGPSKPQESCPSPPRPSTSLSTPLSTPLPLPQLAHPAQETSPGMTLPKVMMGVPLFPWMGGVGMQVPQQGLQMGMGVPVQQLGTPVQPQDSQWEGNSCQVQQVRPLPAVGVPVGLPAPGANPMMEQSYLYQAMLQAQMAMGFGMGGGVYPCFSSAPMGMSGSGWGHNAESAGSFFNQPMSCLAQQPRQMLMGAYMEPWRMPHPQQQWELA